MSGLTFNGYYKFMENKLTNLQYRVQNWTRMDLFYLFIFALAVHAFTRSIYRLYRHGVAYLRRRRKPLIVRRTRRVTQRDEMQPSAQTEAAEDDSDKPIWKPKPKKKHKRKTRQGW
ncbi:uncharacterized protein LOC144658966 [Oculina patagonica]